MNHIYSRSNGIVLSHIAHVDDVLKTSGGELAGLRPGKTQAPLVITKAPPPEEIEETAPVAAAAEAASEKQGRGKKAKAEDPPPPEDAVETL